MTKDETANLQHGTNAMSQNGGKVNANGANFVARGRWKILANALISDNNRRKVKKETNNSTKQPLMSKRQFQSYGLLKVEDGDSDDLLQWSKVTFPNGASVQLSVLRQKLDLSQLTGFNNTGNVCIWPSEECLAVYCQSIPEMFKEKSVIEVGGGQSCLAGLAVASLGVTKEVLLTDGNPTSVENLSRIANANPNLNLSAQICRWDNAEATSRLANAWDVVLCSDCLFFDEGREPLAMALVEMLRPNGVVLVSAPDRGNTRTAFIELINSMSAKDDSRYRLAVTADSEDYEASVWAAHRRQLTKNPEYTPDIHFPKLLILTKVDS